MICNSDYAMEYEIYELQQECNWLTTKTGHGPNCILTSLNKRIKKNQKKQTLNNVLSLMGNVLMTYLRFHRHDNTQLMARD